MAENNYKPNVKVRRASSGLGLFAEENITKNQIVIEYTGDRISSDEADKRGGVYLFNVTKDLVIDGKGRRNKARYINHACKPNAEAEHDDEEDRIYIRARKKIKAGEEVTYDYGKEYVEDMFKKKKCMCNMCLQKR